ncbi:Arc family DNA-binding protein [Xenorhabdus bovienii]|uniref:Arc family DNA-binding protein n=1 Tax=Xenorhabdus bovienii TaxID=40576 RepID=UPI0023B2C61D|nr:Arc family DNA-binding protein [Xenorhabdus bovienii]MDE9447891.1 Arc family DNA-binding protein [Xenorhabdus bovienii]MDE9536140.1 Arc family DNA-binding protein [Xenorhabdus bovienii]
MSREDPQMKIRVPAELKGKLEEAAGENKRSMNAEVLQRLSQSFDTHGIETVDKKIDDVLETVKAMADKMDAKNDKG